MAVDTKKNTSPDAGKEQHKGPGTAAQAVERSQGHKSGDVFKKHHPASTNDNAPGGLIPDLGGS
jgi:hypothetical protein